MQVEGVKRAGKQVVLKLKQEKFNADGSADETRTNWLVPLLIGSKSKPTTTS